MKQSTALAILGSAAALAAVNVAHAGAPEGSWFVAPKAVWVDPDSDHDADADIGGSLGIGKVINKDWDIELAYSDTRHDLNSGGKLKLRGPEINVYRVFMRDSRINPFFAVGMVYERASGTAVASDDFELGVQGKVGVLADMVESGALQLSAEVGTRAYDSEAGNTTLNDVFAGLGLRFNFGGHKATPVAAPAPAPAAAPTPPPPPPPPPAPLDGDKDGVTDDLDKCPGTVSGARVDANGCELDGDKDGVVDRLDRCPRTPAGDKVDAVGCGLNIQLEVLFDSGKATIKAESSAELDNFVDFLKEVPSVKGVMEGHTDSQGADAFNQKLSERRAEAVKAYVVSKGISASRITAKGYGEAKPVADNTTAEGRQQNRRVVFVRPDLN